MSSARLRWFCAGGKFRTPDVGALKHNGGDELVHEVLSSLLGIPETKTPVPERSSRTGYSVNVKHTAFYLFQKQGLVASKELLFLFIALQRFHGQAIRQIEMVVPRKLKIVPKCVRTGKEILTLKAVSAEALVSA